MIKIFQKVIQSKTSNRKKPPLITSNEIDGGNLVIDYIVSSPYATYIDIQISLSENFTTLIYSTQHILSEGDILIPEEIFQNNTFYYIRLRNDITQDSISDWSEVLVYHHEPDINAIKAYNCKTLPTGASDSQMVSLCGNDGELEVVYLLEGRTPNNFEIGDEVFTDNTATTALENKGYIRFVGTYPPQTNFIFQLSAVGVVTSVEENIC